MTVIDAEATLVDDFAWRRPAPFARRAGIALYSWQDPSWSFIWSIILAMPFIIAAFWAPALLSLTPTIDIIAPIAEARAVKAGEASLADQGAPLFLVLLMAGDIFADAPGRIHLLAKALGATLVAYPLAYFVSTRLPLVQASMLTAAITASVAAPFAGSAELALALFLVCAICFISGSADKSPGRARGEGLAAGVALYALWLLNPVFALAGIAVLSACPFLSTGGGLWRYATTLFAFALFGGLAEYLAPGINLARADAASGVLTLATDFAGSEGAIGVGGVAVSAIVVIATAAIFGGREHVRGWLTASVLGLLAFACARLVGASAIPALIVAAAIACFSVASPFYDGIFRNHDRASVSAALSAGALTLFWTVAIVVHAGGQFALQHRAATEAQEDIRTELALVQPGGPTIARWVEEGRFSTPEARQLFALAPIDQSAMLLEAAARARPIAAKGHKVAILTGADTACVIADDRDCLADGPTAANAAKVVFVPRLDFDDRAAEAKGRSEALLITEFRLAEKTALWEIWIRRGQGELADIFVAP
ncbi:MAG: hypothetical protein AAGC77_03870 [Pseudomonadota bacterium]